MVVRVLGERVGQTELVELCLIALCARGHLLLEGQPGLGKTELVKALAGLTAVLLNRYRLSRFFAYPPLIFVALSIIYTSLIGALWIPF